MTAALLVALAVLVLLLQDSSRVTRLFPVESTPSAPRSPALACALAALAAWWLVGGVAGIVVAAVVAVGGPRLLARASTTESEEPEVLAVLPLALDLLGACLSGGAGVTDAVVAVAAAFPGPCGDRLARVAALLSVGALPSDAWAALGDGRDAAGAAARALARAADGGAPVAASVARVAADARRAAEAAAERRAKRAGVLAVLPLGACFLPAFVLLGVVPAVIGLAGPILSSL